MSIFDIEKGRVKLMHHRLSVEAILVEKHCVAKDHEPILVIIEARFFLRAPAISLY